MTFSSQREEPETRHDSVAFLNHDPGSDAA
jgi:hypothetical protein